MLTSDLVLSISHTYWFSGHIIAISMIDGAVQLEPSCMAALVTRGRLCLYVYGTVVCIVQSLYKEDTPGGHWGRRQGE